MSVASTKQGRAQSADERPTAMTDAPFPPMATARIDLRCVEPGDADATSRLMTPAVSRWIASWPVPFTREMAEVRIETMRGLAMASDALPFAAVERASGALIGWVMVNRDQGDRRRGSIGYWLGENHHGQGYMREIAPVALAAGFRLLGLDLVEADAQPGNAGSIAVLLACGMSPTGTRMAYAPARAREELVNTYAITRSAFAERANAPGVG